MNPTEAIEHLISLGWTETAIAAAVGTYQGNINRFRRGVNQPLYALGDKIVRLAAATPKKDRQA